MEDEVVKLSAQHISGHKHSDSSSSDHSEVSKPASDMKGGNYSMLATTWHDIVLCCIRINP